MLTRTKHVISVATEHEQNMLALEKYDCPTENCIEVLPRT
jgi:hypothetical protein